MSTLNVKRMVVLYGMPISPRSRKARWALEESGLAYEYVPIDVRRGETRTPAFLRINPLGTVPALVDGDVTLTEAQAIVWYAAERGGGALASPDEQHRVSTMQALFWEASVLAEPLHAAWLTRFRASMGQAFDAPAWEAAVAAAKGPLATLEAQLAGRSHVAGDRFGAADVAAGASVAQCASAQVEVGPHVERWFRELAARPAFQKTHQEDA